jgi:hypothetical protein
MTSDKPILWGSAAVVLAAAAAIYFYYSRQSTEPPLPAPVRHTSAPAPASTEPPIQHPVPAPEQTAPAPQPLPALNDSDQPVHDALKALPGGAAVEKMLVPQSLVRHIVVTIDNLPRKKVAVELRPLKATAGQFITAGNGDHVTLAPQNYARYAPFIELVKSTDSKQLAALYFHFYPLFQQAYEDLGYPTQYFNDRVIEVIDNLLETPDLKGPVELVQPNVMYQYADPKLEALSAGQKTLLRMGSDDVAIIKSKLHELRALLAPRKPQQH